MYWSSIVLRKYRRKPVKGLYLNKDLSQFRDTLLAALYGNSNIYQLVTNYVEKLSVSTQEPDCT